MKKSMILLAKTLRMKKAFEQEFLTPDEGTPKDYLVKLEIGVVDFPEGGGVKFKLFNFRFLFQ